MKIRFLDVIALVFVTAAIGAVSLEVYSKDRAASQVSIEAEGRTWIYPLDTDRSVDASGPIGVTRILIESGQARIVDSPCPDKLCVHMGNLSKPGQWAACMPNRVFVRIGGVAANEVDGATF
jgi:hypothetical protein